MKKIALFLVLILVLSSAGCGSSENISKSISTPANIDGFQRANFDKFNSPASENGLGGTKIYIDGILEDVDIIKDTNILYGVLNDNAGKWNVNISLEGKEFIKKAELLEGVSVRLFGVYAGFSSKFERPTVDLIKLTKLETAESFHALEYMSFYSAAYDGFIDGIVSSAKELNPKENSESTPGSQTAQTAKDYIQVISQKTGVELKHLTDSDVGETTTYIYNFQLTDTTGALNISENKETNNISNIMVFFYDTFNEEFCTDVICSYDSDISSDKEALNILKMLFESKKDSSVGIYNPKNYRYILSSIENNGVCLSISKE
ncbi:MAG: hypothetical protein IJN40_05075 [Clostridia bacterium]|nr:hypothetical protein [Clostridia bacterium]